MTVQFGKQGINAYKMPQNIWQKIFVMMNRLETARSSSDAAITQGSCTQADFAASMPNLQDCSWSRSAACSLAVYVVQTICCK